MLTEHEIEIRVRYSDADAMGFLHHSRFFVYFEMGRTELLRASGGDYRAMEDAGNLMVVVKAECRYLSPARYDDVLRLHTRIAKVTAAKIEHEYGLFRGATKICEARVTLACIDREGHVQRIPSELGGPGRGDAG